MQELPLFRRLAFSHLSSPRLTKREEPVNARGIATSIMQHHARDRSPFTRHVHPRLSHELQQSMQSAFSPLCHCSLCLKGPMCLCRTVSCQYASWSSSSSVTFNMYSIMALRSRSNTAKASLRTNNRVWHGSANHPLRRAHHRCQKMKRKERRWIAAI